MDHFELQRSEQLATATESLCANYSFQASNAAPTHSDYIRAMSSTSFEASIEVAFEAVALLHPYSFARRRLGSGTRASVSGRCLTPSSPRLSISECRVERDSGCAPGADLLS